ncbi:MAG: DUF4290 domain-containing protein [Bacteroidales bacterium]|nr:DUF4290 domain-containing protein [Bacteroidales bacterium]HOY39585.1 DUF4290 domain-containing protein [Bacteroidales bacterium]HQP05002.1 DUF4290 domain-containing protein [Bacteroidales bacterium]
MDYNTQRSKLIFPEYGRHVHRMVDYLKQIDNKADRTRNAYAVISIMGSMHPHLRDVPEFTHKLWNHLAILADYELDIEWPFPLPDKEELLSKPDMIHYSDNKIAFKHYGKNVENMLKKVNDYENPEERDALITLIANHMKKLFFTWKKEHIEDTVIFEDIRRLSGNAISIPENLKLNEAWDMYALSGQTNNRTRKKKQFKKK